MASSEENTGFVSDCCTLGPRGKTLEGGLCLILAAGELFPGRGQLSPGKGGGTGLSFHGGLSP